MILISITPSFVMSKYDYVIDTVFLLALMITFLKRGSAGRAIKCHLPLFILQHPALALKSCQ